MSVLASRREVEVRPPAPPRAAAVARRLPLPAAVLGGIVAVSAAVQTVLAWARPTPGYFPDEYIYAELGRSFAEGSGPVVRDAAAHFAPLLYPLVTAPAWLLEDVASGYRAVQTLNALLMSLAAIPVYLLGRRLQFGAPLALACAALAVAAPALLYASWTMAEPLAYPLALAAVACAVGLLDRPTLRLQLGFLALAPLAALTRIQLAAIPLAYLVAAAVVGLRRRDLRGLVREQRLALIVLGGGAAAGLVAGLSGHFGYYPSFTYVQVEPLDAVRGLGANALVLAYSVGWLIVPGALLGLGLALARPRVRAEAGFGAMTAALTAALLLQASLYGDTEHVQERYLVYAAPLLVLAFAVYARRGWPLLRAHALLAAGLLLAAATVPLSGYAAAQGSAQSLLLSAHQGAALAFDDVSLAALVFALAAAALTGATLVVAWLSRARATAFALAATFGVFCLLEAAAFSFYDMKRGMLRDAVLPANPSWVDASGVGETTLLLMPRSTRADAHTTLFWNRSVDRLLLFGDTPPPDAFAAGSAEADDAGRLAVEGRHISGPVLVDEYGSSVVLRDARRVAAGPTKTLWRPRGSAQLELMMVGRYYDGAVAGEGGIRVWPAIPAGRLSGRVELELSNPRGSALPIRVESEDGRVVERTLEPGTSAVLRIPVCGQGVWTAAYSAGALAIEHGTRVGLLSSEPRFVAEETAC